MLSPWTGFDKKERAVVRENEKDKRSVTGARSHVACVSNHRKIKRIKSKAFLELKKQLKSVYPTKASIIGGRFCREYQAGTESENTLGRDRDSVPTRSPTCGRSRWEFWGSRMG